VISESTRRALTGRWSISRDPYLFVAPTTVASVVLIEATTYTPSEIFGWFLASAIGYLVFCAVLYLAHRTVFKDREVAPTPVWWIFALGFTAGVIKGVTTAWISFIYGLDVDLVAAFASRFFAAGMLGLIGVPAIAIVMNSLQEFREKRAQLIAEQVLVESRELQSQEVIAAMSDQLRISIESDLDLLLEDLRESLEHKADKAPSWQLIADNLRKTARDSVRSISHGLWEKKSETVPDLKLIDIGRAMITTSAFPLRFILPILLLSAIPKLVNDHGASALWARLTALGALTALVYKIAEFLIRVFPKWKLYIYISALIVASMAPLAFGHLVFGDPIDAQFIGIGIVLAIWLPMLTMTCGLLDTALKQRKEILDDLTKQIDKSRVRSISEDNEAIRLSNDMAKYLHGNLQSRLMASAFAIEVAGRAQDVAVLTAEIEKARQSIRTPFDQFTSYDLEPVSTELRKLLEMWNGVLITELNFAGSDEFVSQSDTRNIIHIVEECFSNSLRHGLATEATVILIATETGTSLTVIDNGLGPREGAPGLGSSLFNSIAGSHWSLTRGPDGVGAQLNLQITK
jgi:signal transduction histidine kinase